MPLTCPGRGPKSLIVGDGIFEDVCELEYWLYSRLVGECCEVEGG